MQINFAHLCDYATISRENKLSVLGIFSVINVQQIPYVHSQAYLAFEVELNYAEMGRPFTIELKCVDADGNSVFEVKGQAIAAPKSGPPKPGERPRIAQALGIQNIALNRTGAYDINIFLNGKLEKQISFEVNNKSALSAGGTPPAKP